VPAAPSPALRVPAPQPLEFLGTAVSTGVMCMALAWVLFDFDET
jgi:hypothetical protein